MSDRVSHERIIDVINAKLAPTNDDWVFDEHNAIIFFIRYEQLLDQLAAAGFQDVVERKTYKKMKKTIKKLEEMCSSSEDENSSESDVDSLVSERLYMDLEDIQLKSSDNSRSNSPVNTPSKTKGARDTKTLSNNEVFEYKTRSKKAAAQPVGKKSGEKAQEEKKSADESNKRAKESDTANFESMENSLDEISLIKDPAERNY
jgi:hypothetical protein